MRAFNAFTPLSGVALGLTLCVSGFGQSYTLTQPTPGDNPHEVQLKITETAEPGGTAGRPEISAISNSAFWQVAVYKKPAVPPGGAAQPPGKGAKPAAAGPLLPASAITVKSVQAAGNYSQTGEVTLTITAICLPPVHAAITDSERLLDPTGLRCFAADHTPVADTPVNDTSLAIEVMFLGGGKMTTAQSGGGGGQSGGGGSSTSTGTGCSAGPAPVPGSSFVNFCLSGIWVPQVGSRPLYSTNSNFSFAKHGDLGSIGIRAQEAADSSTVLDPNAFSSGIFYQAFLKEFASSSVLRGIILNWNLATVEFDRKKKNTNLGTNVNLITAPEFVLPFALNVNDGRGNVKQYGGFEIDAGIEAGHNFKNNINPNGFGTVFRGLLGAQYLKPFQINKKGLAKINVSSQYQVRLLAENEVITKAVHGKLVAYDGHQARNWVSTEVDIMFTKNFGLTLKHDYGALPPGYVFIENRATVGFTVQSSPKSR